VDVLASRDWLNDVIAVGYDPDARSVSGAGAERVMAMVRAWDGVGVLYGTQPVDAPDPLGNPRDFAVMLADAGFTLPDALAALLPPADPIPAGAVA
jgi:hypothetical protein